MNRKQMNLMVGAALAALLASGCATTTAQAADPEGYGGPGRRGGPPPATTPVVAVTPVSGALSQAEIAGLLRMREEEKLARDVYQALYETWHAQVFANITRSEQTHMDAVKGLLDAYGLTDPAAGQPAGRFTDPALQALYDQLLARGRTSLAEAFNVGVAIETLDIEDLDAALAQTTRADIVQVYARLRAGSVNHLAAFGRQG
ncbi:MAG: DUF2202 domain-containing protein [Thermoflexales bacterium]|nr:DUF2202 domain-containing protein [Thermoflexales bacterium]